MLPPLLLVLLVALAVSQAALLSTTIFLHRALTHRALTLHPAVRAAFRVVIWLTTGIRPRQWVAVHRRHHAFTDVKGDPHSPMLEGFAMVQFANVALYRRAAKDPMTVARYARDLPPDRWDRLFFDRALLGLGIGTVVLVALLGPWVGLLAAGFHTVTYLVLNAAVNAVGHRFGRQPHENTARNSQWLAWLTLGEGLHNNHHAAPTTARFSHRPTELDPGWWILRILERCRLVTVRHRQAKLKEPQAA